MNRGGGRRFPSRQSTISFVFEGARLGCFTASTIFFRSCSFRLSPFQILGTSFSRKKNFELEEDLKISLLQFFLTKKTKIFLKVGFLILLKNGKMLPEQEENI